MVPEYILGGPPVWLCIPPLLVAMYAPIQRTTAEMLKIITYKRPDAPRRRPEIHEKLTIVQIAVRKRSKTRSEPIRRVNARFYVQYHAKIRTPHSAVRTHDATPGLETSTATNTPSSGHVCAECAA